MTYLFYCSFSTITGIIIGFLLVFVYRNCPSELLILDLIEYQSTISLARQFSTSRSINVVASLNKSLESFT